MHYNAPSHEQLLRGLGNAVRQLRHERSLTIKALAERARVSQRFLVQLELGAGNISVARLLDVASALGTTPSDLLAPKVGTSANEQRAIVSLIGLRGAGKSTIGKKVAEALGVPFVELDALVAQEAGMSLVTIFEMHGEHYFRRVEREALRKFLARAEATGAVLATGGSIVTDRETYSLLKARTKTVWLKAKPREHWDRVVSQGDGRPMKGRPRAMNELLALLKERAPFYKEAAHTVVTSSCTPREVARQIALLASPSPSTSNHRSSKEGKSSL